MTIIVSAGSTEFKDVAEGQHEAVCYRIADLGTRENPKSGKMMRKCMISFEVVDEQDDEGKNLTISWFGTLSLYEQARMRKHLETWRGKAFNKEELDGFDISKLLGVPCSLYVMKKDKYTNIESIMRWNGTEKPTPTNDIIEIGFDTVENFNNIETLSDKMKTDIYQTPEYIKAKVEFAGAVFADPALQAPINNDEELV